MGLGCVMFNLLKNRDRTGWRHLSVKCADASAVRLPGAAISMFARFQAFFLALLLLLFGMAAPAAPGARGTGA